MNLNFKFDKSFGDLKNGDAFYCAPSGVVWMKLREGDEDKYRHKAVALDDGTVCTFDDSERVIKLDVRSEIVFGN